jgi:hypothetical protein
MKINLKNENNFKNFIIILKIIMIINIRNEKHNI